MPGRHNNDVFKKGWTTMYKNIDKQTKLTLKELVEYQEGQVVSKTLVQNDYVSMTIFSFDKGEEISTHAAGGDAMVTVLEGKGRFTVGDEVFYVEEGETKKWLAQIAAWKEEHPLRMKRHALMSPLDIIEEMNRQFDDAIITTDVGQHMMLVSQYAEITEKKQLVMSGGLGTMGYGFPAAIGAQIGNPEKRVIAVSGDGGMQMNIQEFATAVLEETPVIACVFNNTYLGMVRQWQKLFYGKRYGMTNLRAGALSRRTDGAEFPEYTPDFVKLAESYGAKGIRVTKTEEISAAFEEAKKNTKTPTLIEFIIDPEEMVYPMIKPGGTLEDMIMDC